MEKSNRPQRNRRHSRRAWPPEDDLHYPRPAKRLFTPEIKRMLKEWLVRRRENPYPSREEKKRLAIETGLTYTQICNWFANWRRKLKNSEREKSKKSWGHLIKHYNNNAKGNVEQFSISSEDSIWEEEQEQQRRMKLNERRALRNAEYDDEDDEGSSLCDIEGSIESTDMERNGSCGSSGETQIMDMNYKPNYYIDTMSMNKDPVELFIGREVDVITTTATCQVTGGGVNNSEGATKTKYKQKMMEKYLRDTTNDSMQANNNINNNINIPSHVQLQEQMAPPTYVNGNNTTIIKSGAELSKWLESAAKFTPNKNNYYIEWNSKRNKLEKKPILTKTFLPTANSVNLHTSNTTVTMLPLIYSTTPLVQRENSQDYHNLHHHQRIQHNSPQQIQQQHLYDVIHHKDELDAAEALANLAFNCRQKMLDSATNGRNTISWPLNPISS